MDATTAIARYLTAKTAIDARLIGPWNDGETFVLPGGVQGSICRAVPDRSIVNGVVYADAGAVVEALPELARRYDEAGIRAWTVWVLPGDEAVAAALAGAGHVLDGTPELMCASLRDLDLAPRGETWPITAGAWPQVAALNDVAFGIPAGHGFGAVLDDIPEADGLHRHVLTVDGRPASCVVTCEAGGDAYVLFVATDPAYGRRGLCRATMRAALRGAVARGCTTTSLEASAMGRPVYAALGYGAFGPVQMWERRHAA